MGLKVQPARFVGRSAISGVRRDRRRGRSRGLTEIVVSGVAMALWMEEGAAPVTDSERADLDAISAIKESAALELKEKGNQYVKMGKKHSADAVDCYTRAINQRSLRESENSILCSNRAHVNFLLGNYKRALLDAEEAIKLCSTNIKAFYRAAKASLSLNILNEAAAYCKNGLEQSPSNEELKKLAEQIKSTLDYQKVPYFFLLWQ